MSSTPPQSPQSPQSPEAGPGVGRIVWRDLTVPDAEAAQSFYREVVGWEARPHPMGEYADYDLVPPGGGEEEAAAVAGICHARGENANVPPQWLVYVWVADVRASAARCRALGGRVLDGPRPMGGQLFCAIRGPEGATLALVGSLAVGSAGSAGSAGSGDGPTA